ncbi:hypothetical protein FACS189452_00900 [Bacteroidia bacterium]|nr:hypothetical protein FACS189452_00900 [Bacteroidia bacterium]
MKKLSVIILVLFIAHSMFAQYRKSFAVSGGIGHAWALYDKGEVRGNLAGQMPMANVNFKGAYYITPYLALGLGLSSDSYYKAETSILPLSLNAQYDINPRFFAIADVGFPFGASDILEASVFHAGLGYRIRTWQNGWSLNALLAYRFVNYSYTWHNLDYTQSLDEKRFNHSLLLGISFEYAFASTLPQNEYEVKQRNEKRKKFWLTELLLLLFDWGSYR